jgi:hypothetical protein
MRDGIIKRVVPVFFLIFFLLPFTCQSQETIDFEEISVFLYVPQLGVYESPAYIRDQLLYLPVADIFSFLKIQNTVSPESDSVTGFFINSEARYVIDRTHNRITYMDKVFDLEPGDIVRTENNLYLKSNYFGEIFGLQCTFKFHNLAVFIQTQYELPLIKEMRVEMMRRNINRIKGELKPDTIIPRTYPFFHFGMADWTINTSQKVSGRTDLNLSLSLGSVIAGGEADFTVNYNKNFPFKLKQQYYYWHFVNNDHHFIRQISIGKISSITKSTVYGSILGFNFTNTPTKYRQSFCTYILSDYTEPGWMVELYIKNVLVDYVKSDASGFFTFSVPLQYGSTTIRYRFYSPWGEERFKEQTINIPFTLLPPKIFEYSVSGGIVEDIRNTRFSHVNFHYGIGRRLTLGGGVEYNSSVPSGTLLPFLNFSMGVTTKLLISGEYTYGVRALGLANYRSASGLSLEFYYAWYHRNQKALLIDYLENRRVTLSMPFHISRLSAFMRFSMNQLILFRSNYLYSELLFSGSLWGVSTNLTTIAMISDPVHPHVSSTFSLGFRFLKGFIFTPQTQYNYSDQRFVSVKLGLEKLLFNKGAVNLYYDYNFLSHYPSIQVGLRYDFSFAQTSISAVYEKEGASFYQSAKGSLIYDQKTNFIKANNRTSVGKGGLNILAFLDLNWNGKRDKNEPKVAGLNLKISGGQIENNLNDTLIRIFDLEPFTSYFIELDNSNFNNVTWQVKNKTLVVAIDPNKLKLIEIPVTVAGEVSGMVYVIKNQEKEGQGRVYICIYDSASRLVKRTLSESDGFFSYLGLSPGHYSVKIDSAQLHKLKMVCEPEDYKVTMLSTKDGSVVDGLDFVLRSIRSDTVSGNSAMNEKQDVPIQENKPVPVQEQKPVTVPEKPVLPVREQKTVPVPERKEAPLQEEKEILPAPVQQPGNVVINADSSRYHIQVGAFRVQANAKTVQSKLSAILGRPVIIIQENGYYKLRITGFTRYTTASTFLQKIFRQGFPDAFIHKNR